MPAELFREIKLVEKEAAAIISGAEKKASEIVARSRSASAEIISKKEKELKELYERSFASESEKAARLGEKELLKSSAQLADLRKAAARRKEKALALILEKFEGVVG